MTFSQIAARSLIVARRAIFGLSGPAVGFAQGRLSVILAIATFWLAPYSASALDPDFVIVSVDAPNSAAEGSVVSVDVVVANSIGTITQSGSYIRTSILLSADATIDLGDQEIATVDTPRSILINPLTYPHSVSVTLPTGATGTYYIGAYIDSPDYWTESNESNNSGVDGTPIVIAAPPPAPVLQYPVDMAQFTVGVPVSFEWLAAPGANRYRIKLCTDPGFLTCPFGDPFEDPPASNLFFVFSNLTVGTWYWQVSAIASDESLGWGEWSLPRQLTVDAAPPDFVVVSVDGPDTAAEAASISVDVTVGNSIGEITQAGAFIRTSILLSSDTTITLGDQLLGTFDIDRSFLVTPNTVNGSYSVDLPASTTGAYYIGAYVDSPDFWTESNDGNNTGVDGTPINIAAPPSGPTLTSPADTALVADETPDLNWQLTGSPNYYHLQLATDAGFTAIVEENSQVLQNWHTPAPLADDIYYWRVRTFEAGIWSEWSTTWSFTVGAPLAPPVLQSPANQSVVVDTAPVLTWTPIGDVDHAHVQVSADVDFTAVVREDDAVAATQWSPPTLSNGTYYWRARSYGTGGPWSGWSNPWAFTVVTTAPAAPNLETPPDGAQLAGTPITFDWADTLLATRYQIKIDDTPNMSSPIVSSEVIASDYTLTSSLSDAVWYWQVRGIGSSEQWGPWSERWSFSLNSCTSGNLTGTVTDATTGAVKANVTVALTGEASVLTNGSGGYSFPAASAGAHTLSVSYGSYVDYFQPVSICGNAVQNIALTLPSTTEGLDTDAGMSPDPVNTSTGNFTYEHRDLEVRAPGMPFVFERTYNAQAAVRGETGSLGYGWRHSYDIAISEDVDGNVTVRWGDGKTQTWAPDGGGGYTPQYGVFDTLLDDGDGSFSLRLRDQTVYDFDSSDRLVTIIDRNGNALTLSYTGNDLTQISDPTGRVYTFTIDGSGRITHLTDPLPRTVQFTYDGAGDLVSVIDPETETTQYSYDGNHQLLTVTDPRINVVVENTYDASNRVVTVQRDALNMLTTYEYDEVNRRTTVVLDPGGLAVTTIHEFDELLRLVRDEDSFGNAIVYQYDAAGNRTHVTDRNGNTTEYTYDANGNVTSKLDPDNNTTTITYTANNDPHVRTDALGSTWTFTYDGSGNRLQTDFVSGTEVLSVTTSATYSSSGQPLTLTDGNSHTTTLVYDLEGNLSSEEDPLTHTTTYTYDAIGRRETRTDANTHTTTFVYDKLDRATSVTDPMTGVSSAVFDGNGNLTSSTDPNTNTTTRTYDEKNRLLTITDELTGVVTYTYDALDRRVTATDPENNLTEFKYDPVGNLVEVIDALVRSTEHTYDANGNRSSTEDPLGNTTEFEYDALDRLVAVEDPVGNRTTHTYDALSHRTSTTDAAGRTTSFGYDGLGRLTSVTDPNSVVTSYTYDAVGNRESISDPRGKVTTYVYDDADRLMSITDPLTNTETYGYDDAGNRTSFTNARSETTTYAYDPNDRLTTETAPDRTVTYGYDANGNLTAMTDVVGSSVYVYDELNRVTSVTDGFGKVVGYGYDAARNRTSITYPDTNVVTYTYDALNRLETVTDWLSQVTTYTYDNAGRLTDTTLPNGATVEMGYDTADRLFSLVNKAPDTNPISSYQYSFDATGNITGEIRNEPLAPLRPEISEVYTHGDANQLLDHTPTPGEVSTYTHDTDGNLTQRSAASSTDTYSYDPRSQLTSYTRGGTTVSHTYDGVGRRVARTESGTETRFVLDTAVPLFRVLQETDDLGVVQASYVYGLGLIERIDSGGNPQIHHYDSRGSTIAITNDVGTVTGSYAYDPFGTVHGATLPLDDRFLFLGAHGVMAEDEHLQFVRARFYETLGGRFVSRDPKEGEAVSPQTLNRYVYALSNPVVFVDISGLSRQEVVQGGSNQYAHSDEKHDWLVAEPPWHNPTRMVLDVRKLASEGGKRVLEMTDAGKGPWVEGLGWAFGVLGASLNLVEESERADLKGADAWRIIETATATVTVVSFNTLSDVTGTSALLRLSGVKDPHIHHDQFLDAIEQDPLMDMATDWLGDAFFEMGWY